MIHAGRLVFHLFFVMFWWRIAMLTPMHVAVVFWVAPPGHTIFLMVARLQIGRPDGACRVIGLTHYE
jgi:hypothetical protein